MSVWARAMAALAFVAASLLVLVAWVPRLELVGDAILDGDLPDDDEASTALYLRFDNDGGTAGAPALLVLDECSSLNNDGTATNAPIYISDTFGSPIPQTGGGNPIALALDANLEQYLSIAYHPSLAFSGESFTIEAWVRLRALASGVTPQDRAWLLVRKQIGEGDETIEYALLPQMGAATLSSNAFGKTEGHTGSEIGVILGDAAEVGQWALISHLEITDGDWHYISVAVDVHEGQARFVLDDDVDEFSFEDQGHTVNTGPLTIGAHPSGAGSFESPFDGDIDEIRISRGVVPQERLLHTPGSVTQPGTTYTLDFGTVEPGTDPVELTFQALNSGETSNYSLEGEVDLAAVSDTRLTVDAPSFGPLGSGDMSAVMTVTLDPSAEGTLGGQQLVVTGTAVTYGFDGVGAPATVQITGSVEVESSDDDDTTDDDDSDSPADDDTDYSKGCSCRVADGSPGVVWGALGLVAIWTLRRRVHSTVR